MKITKKFKSCWTADSVLEMPPISHQQGEGKEAKISSNRSLQTGAAKRDTRGRFSDNIDQLSALVTDERMFGAMQQTHTPRYRGAANKSEGETLSLADSLMDGCDEDLQWHKQRNGKGDSENRRTSHLEKQWSEAMQPVAPPQSKLEPMKGPVTLNNRVLTNPETSSDSSSDRTPSMMPSGPTPTPPEFKMMSDPGEHISPTNWGFPGYLSSAEYDIYLQFRAEIAKRPSMFRDTIYCFGYEEEEPFALCRWLRARKFDFEKVVLMVEQAIDCSAEASKMSFYPDSTEALGVEPSVYFSLYPELFVGYSKQGCPLYITRAGECDLRKIMSVTTEPKIIKFHWHCMKYAFGGRLSGKRRSDPNVHRFEGFVVFDMEGLSVQGCMDALNVFKAQSSIDQLCYPESLNRFVVINAPAAFSVIWRIVKTLIDARTSAKVEIFASRKQVWQKRLLELVDSQELPSDYGGKAPSTMEVFRKQTTDDGLERQFTMPITTKGSAEETNDVCLQDGETLELSVYTKSTKTGIFSVSEVEESKKSADSETVSKLIHSLEVRHKGEGFKLEEEEPTIVKFPQVIKGPGKFVIQASCKEGKEVFVLVGRVISGNSRVALHSPAKPVPPATIESQPLEQTLTDDSSLSSSHHEHLGHQVIKQARPPRLYPVDEKRDHYNAPSVLKAQARLSNATYTGTIVVPASPHHRAVRITVCIVMFVMMHDFWLIWAMTEGGASCKC